MKLSNILISIVLILLFANLSAQTPQGIGKFKISDYTLDSLFSEYEFSDLKDSWNNFSFILNIHRFGGNKNYEILSGDGYAYYPDMSGDIKNQRIFNICNFSVAGLDLKGLNLYFFEGILYKICILNNVETLLEKLIIKYPSIEKDETKNEKQLFQNAFGATIEKPSFSRDGNWLSENGISVSFFDDYHYNDQGDFVHIEQIKIYNVEIENKLKEIQDEVKSEKIKREEQKVKEEIMKSDL